MPQREILNLETGKLNVLLRSHRGRQMVTVPRPRADKTRDKSPLRICFVGDSIDGPHSLSPTAMATGVLARIAAEVGLEVTVLVPGRPPADLPLTEWISRFDRLGITLECLFLPDMYPAYVSWMVFRHLRRRRKFETVIFLDRGAIGYWSIRAKNQGVEFPETRLVLAVADPSEFGFREKWTDPPHPQFLMTLEMERFLLKEAETIWTMSDRLAEYVRQSGAKAESIILPPVLPTTVLNAIAGSRELRDQPPRDVSDEKLPSVVSLGFAGLADDTSNVRRIAEYVAGTWNASPLVVAEFMAIGSAGLLATGEDGYSMFALALRGWPGRIELRPCKTLEEFAADVAAQPLIVVPGRPRGLDTVTEWITLASGHPVINLEADSGSQTADIVGTSPGVRSIDQFIVRLQAAWRQIPEALRLADAFPTMSAHVAEAFRNLIGAAPPKMTEASTPARVYSAETEAPKVSVCISHFDRPALLEQTLESLRTQTYPNVEVVLYDDASPSAATKLYLNSLEAEFTQRGWKLVRGESDCWPAAGRNAAARHATGDYLLMMDDDNCARPSEIETMMAVARRTGADAVTCFSHLFEGEAYPQQSESGDDLGVGAMPLAHGVALGSIWNIFGDTNYLYKAEVFREIGGFEDLPTVGCEDYQISCRMALKGYRLESIPMELYDYRYSPHNMAKGISNERAYYSHIRISSIVGRNYSCPRIIFDLAAMSFNAHTQKNAGSYWRNPARRVYSDPLEDAPMWRDGMAAVKLAAAFSAYGAQENATAVARFALTNPFVTRGLTPDMKGLLLKYYGGAVKAGLHPEKA